ncbi:uncharacterized protein LOC126894563 isoform X3 [Daktulosphaira vitifoliae]|uniref:uncharacterized protein LOC126894563 isoform X3 n=1 Tax=Daktulosphaira vitifoliae TaxID=58002 RepID=UPI0021A99344|nr:uncharacterized protein LOC126894563 isoform X3 [Daktulosphaira vitifoliae]
MYIFFFIMMYLASSLSNAFLFTVPPFDENSKLNDTCETELKHIFQTNKHNNEGIDFSSFKYLLLNFKHLHKYNDNEIERLFTNEVEINGLMDEKQFLKQVINVVKRIETTIENFYKAFLIHNKMTITELISALMFVDCQITNERAIQLINIEKTDPQNISREAFRNIYAKLYNEYLHERQDTETLMKSFPLYESLDPR